MSFIMFLIFLIYGFTVASCYHTVIYMYHFIDVAMTWTEAQQYCRQHYTDLATIHNTEDLDKLTRPSTYTGDAWIGLFDDVASWKGVMGNDSNSWTWSVTGTTSTSQYQNWASGQPDYNSAVEKCLYMNSGLWFDGNCADRLYVVCFTGLTEPGFKNYTYVPTLMTWEDAQKYCRQHHTDLAMIENQTENMAVASITLGKAWLGLYRKPWRWSDGSTSNVTSWENSRPNNYGEVQHCVLENSYHDWNDFSCSSLYPFFCHRAVNGKRLLMPMKLQSGADLSHPDMWSELLDKIEEELLRMGSSHLKVRWKNTPKMTIYGL